MKNPIKRIFGRKKNDRAPASADTTENTGLDTDRISEAEVLAAKRRQSERVIATAPKARIREDRRRKSDSNKALEPPLSLLDSKPFVLPKKPIPPTAPTTEVSAEGSEEEPNVVLKKEAPAPVAPPVSKKMDEPEPKQDLPVPEDDKDEVDVADQNLGDPPHVLQSYDTIPLLDQVKLPRGGISVETKAVGRVQFGLPPETIKDSMSMGIPVPQVYIVPVERFSRDMGPALGVNLAEFEFPAYFNFFVYKKRCTLVVDSDDAEENIRRVFGETLLGPAQFRQEKDPIRYEEEDFAPDFPIAAIPDFQRELNHFRVMPDGTLLDVDLLLNFCHFEMRTDGHENLGVPPKMSEEDIRQTEPVEDDCKPDEVEEREEEEEPTPASVAEMEKREKRTPWSYSQARFMGDVATVWPPRATEEEIKARSVPRVEIFKMPGGTEYIIHDVDADNQIIGKARISGHVKVSEQMSVDGFGGHSILEDVKKKGPTEEETKTTSEATSIPSSIAPSLKSFHPPSFGVTVLGNSHGFDKSGSVSGYVLWINGRGVMIDPPPYSSATLEREGIRPRTIVGIILTHCHADHDAGAFQKVLTGSPVVVITTPTIYKSFIRKYAALSALSPALLRHSHRYKRAVIGQPLRFQGATFHFTYTLHSIPCVGFKVEWRGRSMVFTGDHFNSPPAIDELQAKGVLSKARADDLRSLPLQECDLLLHEAGVPPLHTPLSVLLELPKRVRQRLFVVHTSALPEDCELRVAPTGTAGTIRLDQPLQRSSSQTAGQRPPLLNSLSSATLEDEFAWSAQNEYQTISEEGTWDTSMATSFAVAGSGTRPAARPRQNSVYSQNGAQAPPLVSLRPASSTDAWFILNLLSAVPFLSSLSYASTMEVLETARVDAYTMDGVVVPASRRSQVLCVIWEGTCCERPTATSSRPRRSGGKGLNLGPIDEGKGNQQDKEVTPAVWHAGDWTGPIALQPERKLSGESKLSTSHNIVAVSSSGVKVITVEYSSLQQILKSGSPLFRKYLERKALKEQVRRSSDVAADASNATDQLLDEALKTLNILDLLNCNFALRKLNAVQKRHLESLAEGPISYQPAERLWRAGAPVDKAFLVVSGTASFVPKRRNAGSATVSQLKDSNEKDKMGDPNVGESMRVDVMKAIKEMGMQGEKGEKSDDMSSMSSVEAEENKQHFSYDTAFRSQGYTDNAIPDAHDYVKLSRGLQKRAEALRLEGSLHSNHSDMSGDDSVDDGDSLDTENEQLDYSFPDDVGGGGGSRRGSIIRRRSSRARQAQKVLGRLYTRRAFTGGLVFSRGHFLGDVSKMVAGLLSPDADDDQDGPKYGFGEKTDSTNGSDNLLETIIHEQEGNHHIMHSSTLTAGKDGCVVLVFPKASLIPFLDEYPGLLLSLLGTQVVV